MNTHAPITRGRKAQDQAFQVVLAIVALLVVPATMTLVTAKHPGILNVPNENPTPSGYTVSLSLFIMPLVCIGWWFLKNPSLQFPRRSFWLTVGVLVPSGFVLDLLFGNDFFSFENTQATLGIVVPALGGAIPIEELVF